MKIVEDERDLDRAFYLAQREALTAFGNSEIYVEEYVPEARHIEIQILADNKGNVVHLNERDCSIQRRHQKLIEESPSPLAVSEKFRKRVGDLGVKAARAMKYRNVGTIEFLVSKEGEIYFMEVNTRIQVEHPVTEEVTGIDILKEQIMLAAGFPLEYKQSRLLPRGHAIECRINAEDPERFIPSPGKITFLSIPGGPGVRVDTALYPGYVIPPHYDSLIAKVVAHGKDREEAIARMRRALDEFVIEGIQTTIPFHKKVLNNPDFLKGEFYTNFVEKMNSLNK